MERPKRRSPTKYSRGQEVDPTEEVSFHKVTRGKGKGQKAVDVRTSTSTGAVEVGVGVKGAKKKKPVGVAVEDLQVRTSASENQVSIGVNLHHPHKQAKEMGKTERSKPRELSASPHGRGGGGGGGDKGVTKHRRRRPERGDGEKRSISPEKTLDRTNIALDAKCEARKDAGEAPKEPQPQPQTKTDPPAVTPTGGGFIGFVQNIVSFLSPGPQKKRRSGPKMATKRGSWQSGRPMKMRLSDKNMELLKKEAEAARKRYPEKDCTEVRHTRSMKNGEQGDKIEVLHTRATPQKTGLQDVKTEKDQTNKGRKTTTTEKNATSIREDKGRDDPLASEKGDQTQVVAEKVSTGKTKRNFNNDENKTRNSSKKTRPLKQGDGKVTQQDNNTFSVQTAERTKEKKRTSDVPNKGTKRGLFKSGERSSYEQRQTNVSHSPTTKDDPEQKSNVKHSPSKRLPGAAPPADQAPPSPIKDTRVSARNVDNKRVKSRGPEAIVRYLKLNSAERRRETDPYAKAKCQKSKAGGDTKLTVKSIHPSVKVVTKTVRRGESKGQQSHARDASEHRVQPATSPPKKKKKKKKEINQNNEGKRPKSQARDASEQGVKPASAPAKGIQETDKMVDGTRNKSKARENSENKAKQTSLPAKGVKKTDSSVPRKRPKSKPLNASAHASKSGRGKEIEVLVQDIVGQRPKSNQRDTSEQNIKSTTSTSKLKKTSGENVDGKSPKTRIESKSREGKKITRPAGHTVSVEVLTSLSKKDKAEFREKRSKSSGQPNENRSTGPTVETPSKVSSQRQKREQAKEKMLASSTDDDEGRAYERPRKSRCLPCKKQKGDDSKTISKSGVSMQNSTKKMDKNEFADGEAKSLKSKKSVQSKKPSDKKVTQSCEKVDCEKVDLIRENEEKPKVKKDKKLPPEGFRESASRETKLSVQTLEDIRDEAKRLGVALTPKVNKFLADLKQSLMHTSMGLKRSRTRPEQDSKIGVKSSKTQKRCRSAAAKTVSDRNKPFLENESTGNRPKHEKCHSSATLEMKDRKKRELAAKSLTSKVSKNSEVVKSNLKGAEKVDGLKRNVPIEVNGNKGGDSKEQAAQNSHFAGLGDELLNTLTNDRRLLDNLEALCEAIRTGQPYVGKPRIEDRQAGKNEKNKEEDTNEKKGGDLKKTKSNTKLAAESPTNKPGENVYAYNVECDICSVDMSPYQKKFARYLEDSYLERSACPHTEWRKAAKEPNLISKETSDKDECASELKNRKKLRTKNLTNDVLPKKEVRKTLSSTSIANCYNLQSVQKKGLKTTTICDELNENKGDWIFNLTQSYPTYQNSKQNESEISKAKQYENLKENNLPSKYATQILQCLIPNTNDAAWEKVKRNREQGERRAEVNNRRSNRKGSSSPKTKVKRDARDSSSGSASTAIILADIYSKADEIFKEIMEQRKLQGNKPSDLFASIVDQLLQSQLSKKVAKENEERLKHSRKERRERLETDTCTTVSLRSSSRDQVKDAEGSREKCHDKKNVTGRETRHLHYKSKGKERGKCRSKRLERTLGDVSNMLINDSEKRFQQKRRVRKEDVLLARATESAEQTTPKIGVGVQKDSDNFLRCCQEEDGERVLRIEDYSYCQVFRKASPQRPIKTERGYREVVGGRPNVYRLENDSVTASEFSSYQIQDNVESDEENLISAHAFRKRKRELDRLNTLKTVDQLAMASKEGSPVSQMVRQQTTDRNRDKPDDTITQLEGKKGRKDLKEPTFEPTGDSRTVCVNTSSSLSSNTLKVQKKRVLASAKKAHFSTKKKKSTLQLRVSVPTKVLEIYTGQKIPVIAKAYLETGSTKHRPSVLKRLSAKRKAVKCKDNGNEDDATGTLTTYRQESRPRITDTGRGRGNKTSKDKSQIIRITKTPLKQKFVTNVKSVSPQKVADYLRLNMHLKREKNESPSWQMSPCSETSNNLSVAAEKTFPKQTKQVLTKRKPSLLRLQMKEKKTSRKDARNNVSKCSAKLFNRKATKRTIMQKSQPTSSSVNVSKQNKNVRESSPVRLSSTQPMTKLNSHKFDATIAQTRAESRNLTQAFSNFTKTGVKSLNKPVPLHNTTDSKRFGNKFPLGFRRSVSETSIPPTKVVTLPKMAKTPKVTNIYTVQMDQQPSSYGMKPENISSTVRNETDKSLRVPTIPSLQQRSKSDMTRTVVKAAAAPKMRERTNVNLPTEQCRTRVDPNKESIHSKGYNKNASTMGRDANPRAAITSGKRTHETNFASANVAKTKAREYFQTRPDDPVGRTHPSSFLPVYQRVETTHRTKPSIAPQGHSLAVFTANKDRTDEACGREIAKIQHPCLSLPKPLVQNQDASKLPLFCRSNLQAFSYTPDPEFTFSNPNSIENVTSVMPRKKSSRFQCSVGLRSTKLSSKIFKSRGYSPRPAFVSVVRTPREEFVVKKPPKAKVFASRMKIVPSQTHKVVDARCLTSKISSLQEMRRRSIAGKDQTQAKVECSVSKRYDLDRENCSSLNKNDERCSSSYGPAVTSAAKISGSHEKPCRSPCRSNLVQPKHGVERSSSKQRDPQHENCLSSSANNDRYSSFKVPLPTSPCNPWQKEAEAKQMWWEKHGDKFERKVSKTLQDVEHNESSCVNEDVSQRGQNTTRNGSHGPRKQHKSKTRELPNVQRHGQNARETINRYYRQSSCVGYVAHETKMRDYSPGAMDYEEFSENQTPVEDSTSQTKKQEVVNEKTTCNEKQKMPSIERKYTWSDRDQTLTRKRQINNDENETSCILKRETHDTGDSATHNDIPNRNLRSRTRHGSPTNFVRRNIIALAQPKSIVERNRTAAKKSVEKWKQHYVTSNTHRNQSPRSASPSTAIVSVGIAKREEELQKKKRCDDEDTVSPRRRQHKYENDIVRNGDQAGSGTKKERSGKDNEFNGNACEKGEPTRVENTGAIPRHRQDGTTSKLERACSRKRAETRSASEEEDSCLSMLPMDDNCDLSYHGDRQQYRGNESHQNTREQCAGGDDGATKQQQHRATIVGQCLERTSEKATIYKSSQEKVKHRVEQTRIRGNTPNAHGREDESGALVAGSGPFGRYSRENIDKRKYRRAYPSDGESGSCSGSSSSYSCSSANSRSNTGIENVSSSSSGCTSSTSQDASSKGEDESACTQGSECSYYGVGERSSNSQHYVCGGATSYDSPAQSNYSLEYQKGEANQTKSSKDKPIKKVSSPKVDENPYGNGIETTIMKQTSIRNEKCGEKVMLMTPSSENILEHAVGSKKLSRPENTLKQFYKTVQIPHGPSPSSLRIRATNRCYQRAPAHAPTRRPKGGNTAAVVPYGRDQVARMPTILSENTPRAMKRDLDGRTVERPGDPAERRGGKGSARCPQLPPPPPVRTPARPPQSSKAIQTLRKKSTPTQTDKLVLGRDAIRHQNKGLQGKGEAVYNIKDTSYMAGSHKGETKSPTKEKEESNVKTISKKSTGKGREIIETGTHQSEKNPQKRDNSPIRSEVESNSSASADKQTEEQNYLHCFFDDKSSSSQSPQRNPDRIVEKTCRTSTESSKRTTTTNYSQDSNRSKQQPKHEEPVKRVRYRAVDQLRKIFETSNRAISIFPDNENRKNRRIRASIDKHPTNRSSTPNRERSERAHLNHGERSSVNRAQEPQNHQNDPSDLSDRSLSERLERKNVKVIKAPFIVSDDSSSYSTSTCSFECPVEKQPSKHIHKELPTLKTPAKTTKHVGKVPAPIAKKENQCSPDRKTTSSGKHYEKEGTINPEKSSKKNETVPASKQSARDDRNDGHNDKNQKNTAQSNADAISMVYKNTLCNPVAPSEEIISANCDTNTQLFKLLTRNLDGNGTGKNYLIINNCLKEIVVTVDESGFKLAAKSSAGEDDEAEPLSKLKEKDLPQVSEKIKSHSQKSKKNAEMVIKENANKHNKGKETTKSTASPSKRERSPKRSKRSTEDLRELSKKSTPLIVANTRNVQKSDGPFTHSFTTVVESQDVGDSSTASVADRRFSSAWMMKKSSEYSSATSGMKYLEQVPTERSLDESKHMFSTSTKSCLDEPWSVATNINSSTSRTAGSRHEAAVAPNESSTVEKEWSPNESSSKSSLEETGLSSNTLVDLAKNKGGSVKTPQERRATIVPSSTAATIQTSTESTVNPEPSTRGNDDDDAGKRSNETNVSPPTTQPGDDHEIPLPDKRECSSLGTLSTMSFIDRSTPAVSKRSSIMSIKEEEQQQPEAEVKQQPQPSTSTQVEPKGGGAASESRTSNAEVQTTAAHVNSLLPTSYASSESAVSVRAQHLSGHSRKEGNTSKRSHRREKVVVDKKVVAGETTTKEKLKQKSSKRDGKRRTKEVGASGKDGPSERNSEKETKDILSILYEKDKRLYEESKHTYNDEENRLLEYQRSVSEASTKRQKKKKKSGKHSKEKDIPVEVSKRDRRKQHQSSSNKKKTKKEAATGHAKKSDSGATHKIFTQVGKWIGKKIDKI